MLKTILAVLLFCGSVKAESPVIASYRDFSGGLDNFYSPTALAQNESPNLLNVVIDEPMGALTQRKGYTACGTIPSGATATALYEYSKNDGSRRLIVSDNNTIWQTGDCINYSTIATNLGDLNLPRFATVQDNLWIVNGSTYPIVWNGTTGYYLDGASNRPLGPKGKLIAYWKARVWIGNTATSPSGLYFSAAVDTNGEILNPATSTMAWANAANLIYFNRDNGSPLYGIKVYRDNMYAFKENDILRLLFTSEFVIGGVDVKTVSKIGSKFQESIVEMDDGLLRFVGKDGIYAFDGSIVKRISTKWTPTFYTIKQPTHGEQYALWDSASDWLAGSVDINTSTSLVPGSLVNGIEDFADLNYSANPVWTVYSGAYSASTGKLVNSTQGQVYIPSNKYTGVWEFDYTMPTVPLNNNELITIASNDSLATLNSPSVHPFSYSLFVAPNGTGNTQFSLYGTLQICKNAIGNTSVPTGSVQHIKIERNAQNFTLNVGTMTCSGTASINLASSTYTSFYAGGYNSGFGNISWVYKSTSVYTSQISTATGLTLWKTFDVDQTNVSSTSISYQVRVASTIYNLGLASYNTIVPGSIVSASTNTFYQWKANLATTDNGVTPILNSASVGWVTGDSSKSPLTALAYKSRYWLAASVGLTNSYNDLTMVESKSPLMTYTKYDLPLSAMTLWNSNLYAAIGNTSKIVRVDYGDTDDGNTITSYWESRDEVYDNPVLYKTINTGILDYSNSPANTGLQVGISSDMGATYQDRTVDLSASTLARNTIKLNYDANTAIGFRTRVYNVVPGVGFKIYGLHNIGTMTDFMGN